jgi:glycosyltransferase involved in cell wall biosynthesis
VQQLFYSPITREKAEQMVKDALGDLPPYVLTVGSINSRKNLLGMVKALHLLPAAERPLLLVVGNGREYRQRVEKYVEENNLGQWVRIETGIHDGALLQALYTKALCMLYPSFYEGFGLPVVEASLQHCAVITSNVSSLPEAAGPEALQVNPSSAEEIAEALRLLLSDGAERQRRAEAGYAYCMEHFLPEKLTQQMYGLYQLQVLALRRCSGVSAPR